MSIRVEFMLQELQSEIDLGRKEQLVRGQLEEADRDGRVVEMFKGNTRVGFFTYQVRYVGTIPHVLFGNGYVHPAHRHPHNFLGLLRRFRGMYKDGVFLIDSRRRQTRREYAVV